MFLQNWRSLHRPGEDVAFEKKYLPAHYMLSGGQFLHLA